MDLMRRQQEVKISEVWITSGFATESSFFRNFKAVTGMKYEEDWIFPKEEYADIRSME